MKKNLVCILWIWIAFQPFHFPTLASDVIWTEDYSTDENTGCAHDGTSSPGSGKWSTDCSSTVLTDANDYFKVISGQFEARDLDGEAIWTSTSIDISAYKDVFFTLDLSHTDALETSDYIEVYYKIDSNPEQLSLTQTGSFADFTHTETGLSGSSLIVIIIVKNNANLEKHRFDNLVVEGTPENQLAAVSFENTGDTWNYDIFPASYNSEATGDSLEVNGDEDVWGSIKKFSGEISNAAHKEKFWGIQDLDNDDEGNGGSSFYHYLAFAPVDISGYKNVVLTFQYYTIGLDNGDEIEYIIAYDNGSTWGTATALNKNTEGWTTISVNVPDDKEMIRLRLQAKQNGGDDFAGWDDIRLTGEAITITHYYATSANNLEQTAQWNDGSGGQPVNFTTDNQFFHILTDGDATIGNNWTVSGENSKVIIGDGSTATNFIIPASFSLIGKTDVKDGATLTIENLSSPTFGNLSESSTVVYQKSSGVSNQEIPQAVYGNLTLKNSNPTKAFTGDVTVLGNLSLENVTLTANVATDLFLGGNLSLTGTVNFNTTIQNNLDIIVNGSGTQTFSGSPATGNIQLKSLTLEKVAGEVIIADAPSTTLSLNHDLTLDYYNITPFSELDQVSIGRNLVINGNINQSIDAGTYEGLTIETVGDTFLSGDVTVNNILKLTDGNLLLSDYDLTLAGGADIQGGSSASYVVTKDDKSSGGFLIRETPNDETEVIFPVGTAESFTPCYITNASTGNTETFSVRVFNKVFENGTAGAEVADLENLVKKTWEITPVLDAGANVTLKLQWNTTDQGNMFDKDFVNIIKYRDQWNAISEKQEPGENSSIYTTTASGITEFSKFTVGGESATLPVTWLSFTANKENGYILLSWQTATEANNKGFEVQRSVDGNSFQTIGFVNGTGHSSQIKTYTYQDFFTHPRSIYYRLKQIDFDGNYAYSKIMSFSNTNIPSQFTVFPNPTSGMIQFRGISHSHNLHLQLTDVNGKIWFEKKGPVKRLNEYINKYLPSLPSGMYSLQLTGNSEVLLSKIMKID